MSVVQYFTDMAQIERLAGALFVEQERRAKDPVLKEIFTTFVTDEMRHSHVAQMLDHLRVHQGGDFLVGDRFGLRRARLLADALAGAGEDLAQDVGDLPLGRDEPRHLGVRRVREEEVDTLLAQACECVEVGEAAVQRELVHLEVAGVDRHARGGADGHGQRVRDGVVDGVELSVEVSDALAVPLRHLEGVRADAVLLQLGVDEGEGELGADQRDVRLLAQEEGDTADVVLVPVR